MDGNSAAIELARRLSRTYQPPSVSAGQYELPASNSRSHTPLQTIYYTAVPRGLPCLWVSQHLAACSGTDFCNVCRKGYGISLDDHHGEHTRRRLWARHRHTVPAACLHHGFHRRTCPRMNDPDHPNVLIDDGGSGLVFYTIIWAIVAVIMIPFAAQVWVMPLRCLLPLVVVEVVPWRRPGIVSTPRG